MHSFQNDSPEVSRIAFDVRRIADNYFHAYPTLSGLGIAVTNRTSWRLPYTNTQKRISMGVRASRARDCR